MLYNNYNSQTSVQEILTPSRMVGATHIERIIYGNGFVEIMVKNLQCLENSAGIPHVMTRITFKSILTGDSVLIKKNGVIGPIDIVCLIPLHLCF